MSDATANLLKENRRLRKALETLLDEIDTDNGTNVDTSKVRNEIPTNEVKPPWEREGYDSKQAWLADK